MSEASQISIPRPTQTNTRTRRGIHYDPYDHAHQLGIDVLHRPLTRAHGLWLPDHQCIVLKHGLRGLHERSTLAHEIAHAVLGHHGDRPRHEWAADKYAAEHLISPQELHHAMRYCPDLPTLSLELQVSERILAAYLSNHNQVLACQHYVPESGSL